MPTIDNSSEQSRVGRKKRAEARERLLNGLAAGACEYFQKKAWEDLRNVEPRDRLFFWEKFMQYLAPKLQTEKQETEIKGSVSLSVGAKLRLLAEEGLRKQNE